jgi:hypothetical protein
MENQITTPADPTTNPVDPATTPKTYTDEEIAKLIQSEADRRVTEAQKRWQKDTQKQLTEAQKLAKMSQEEQARYQMELKEAELAQRAKEFDMRETKIEAMKVLSQKGLPVELLDYITLEDASQTMAAINSLESLIKKEVAAQVSKRIGGTAPAAGVNTVSTAADFSKLSYTQKVELQKTNPELYKKLASGK